MPRKPACHKLTETLGGIPGNGGCQVTVGCNSVSAILLDIACSLFEWVDVRLDIHDRKDRSMFKEWMVERYGNISKCPKADVRCVTTESGVSITRSGQHSAISIELSDKDIVRYTKSHHLPIFVSLGEQ